MYFFTHLFISKVLYQHFAGEVELNKRAFAYGNIKPDIPSKNHKDHTLENYLNTVWDLTNQLIQEDLTVEEFSVQLGEICHYICDFFCYYHVLEEIYNNKLHHFYYEIRLHYKLMSMNIKQRYRVPPSNLEPRKDICSMVLEKRKAYFSQPTSMLRDIDFAFSTAVWTCESIIYYLKSSTNPMQVIKDEFYSFLAEEGGSI